MGTTVAPDGVLSKMQIKKTTHPPSNVIDLEKMQMVDMDVAFVILVG